MYRTLLAVGIGSFIGGICRFLTQTYVQKAFPSSFPYGTLTVNIIGCFIIGLIYALAARGNLLSPQWRIFLATGFCGGFTTFSSFAYENIALLTDGELLFTGLYLALSMALGLLAAYFGTFIIKSI